MLHWPLRAAVGGEGSTVPQGWGWFGNISSAGWEMAARGIWGDKGPTPMLARLAGPREKPAAAGSSAQERPCSAFAERRSAEQDGFPGQGDEGAAGRRSGRPRGARPRTPRQHRPVPRAPGLSGSPRGCGVGGQGDVSAGGRARLRLLSQAAPAPGAGRCPPHLPRRRAREGVKSPGRVMSVPALPGRAGSDI